MIKTIMSYSRCVCKFLLIYANFFIKRVPPCGLDNMNEGITKNKTSFIYV